MSTVTGSSALTKGLSVVSNANPNALALHINFDRESQDPSDSTVTDRVTLNLQTAEWLLEELTAAVDNCRQVQDSSN